MQKATISQLKNHLSRYLQRVRAGETVLILDRKRPVARIERVTAEKGVEARLIRLERDGLLRRAAEPLSVEWLAGPAAASSASVLDALVEERREQR